MTKNEPLIPKFANERDEAKWWDAHPEVATRLLKRALRQGSARRPAKATRIVTMRIPIRDLEAAQRLAGRKGLPYQTYMKMLLHQAIEKEQKAV